MEEEIRHRHVHRTWWLYRTVKCIPTVSLSLFQRSLVIEDHLDPLGQNFRVIGCLHMYDADLRRGPTKRGTQRRIPWRAVVLNLLIKAMYFVAH
jgi:hypothetical protein